MSLNVNTALYSLYGVDPASVEKVSGEILRNASSASENQPKVASIDYSKFNRATLGIDLYSSRTDPELQKQIALTKAGLYAQAVNVAKLNANAAMNLYSASTVQKNVEMTQSTTINEFASPRHSEQNDNVIELFNIADKHSNSSNGFNPFADEYQSDKEKSEK